MDQTLQAQRIAATSLKNGLATQAEQTTTAAAAQQAGVTVNNFIRARLFIEAGIPLEEWPRDEGGDLEC